MTLLTKLNSQQEITRAWAKGVFTNWPDCFDWKRPKEKKTIDNRFSKIFNCQHCGCELVRITGINDHRKRTCFQCKVLQQAETNFKKGRKIN